MRALLFAVFALALAIQSSAQPQKPVIYTGWQLQGLSGPVHTVKVTRHELNKDPRPEKTKLWINPAMAWLVFNEKGDQAEVGTIDAAGNPAYVIHTSYDEDHKRKESVGPDGVTGVLEDDRGPFGITEERSFREGKLLYRTVITYDEQGRDQEARYFNSEGELTQRYAYRYDKGLKEERAWNEKGELTYHSLTRFDDDGDPIERIDFDMQGRPYTVLRMVKLELISYWVDPACKCANGIGLSTADDRTVFYLINEQGEFTKQVQHHRGKRTNFEPDSDEKYDNAGRLLDRVTYTYERDLHGNWTRRIASVLDPATGSMLPVEEETRTITYY